MMRFRYRPEPLRGKSLASSGGASVPVRPFVPTRVFGPSGQFISFRYAVADTGCSETIFPADTVSIIKATLLPITSQSLVWRGSSFPIRFARVELEISSTQEAWRWPATVGFTSAPIPFPLLGMAGFFEYFDACFLGDDKAFELTANAAFVGTKKSLP
jgi:hypothetical protein